MTFVLKWRVITEFESAATPGHHVWQMAIWEKYVSERGSSQWLIDTQVTDKELKLLPKSNQRLTEMAQINGWVVNIVS